MLYWRMLEHKNTYLKPDDGAGAGGAEAPPADGGAETPPAIPAFGDLLKDKGFKADLDRHVGKALDTARGKWDQEKQEAINAAKTEAERLAQLSAEERAEEARKTKEDAMSKREAEITRRELRATALEELAQKGLPSSLADVLVYTDADACNASIASVETAFRAAVQQGVEERLKGGSTTRVNGAGGAGKSFGLKDIENMTPAQINENWESISKSLNGGKK